MMENVMQVSAEKKLLYIMTIAGLQSDYPVSVLDDDVYKKEHPVETDGSHVQSGCCTKDGVFFCRSFVESSSHKTVFETLVHLVSHYQYMKV